MNNADEIIKYLDMSKHPEGGYFKETYRSGETIKHQYLPKRFTIDHAFSTAIYFLLKQGDFSALHTIKQEEIWHFYSGTPIDIHMIHPDGDYEPIHLGNDILNGEIPQGIVPAGSVFGATVCDNSKYDYSLVGCTVAPGFEFEDFTLHKKDELLERFPRHRELIESLTRE
jgi:hypothetical protein